MPGCSRGTPARRSSTTPSLREAVAAKLPSESGQLPGPRYEDVPVGELARRQGVHPIATVDELADPDAFDSDEDLEDFLTFIYASRRAELG